MRIGVIIQADQPNIHKQLNNKKIIRKNVEGEIAIKSISPLLI